MKNRIIYAIDLQRVSNDALNISPINKNRIINAIQITRLFGNNFNQVIVHAFHRGRGGEIHVISE